MAAGQGTALAVTFDVAALAPEVYTSTLFASAALPGWVAARVPVTLSVRLPGHRHYYLLVVMCRE